MFIHFSIVNAYIPTYLTPLQILLQATSRDTKFTQTLFNIYTSDIDTLPNTHYITTITTLFKYPIQFSSL